MLSSLVQTSRSMPASEISLSGGQQNIWSGVVGQNNWSLYCGDALKGLTSLESACADCICTSPPYFWKRDYGEGQIGHEPTIDAYVDAIVTRMDEARRVLKPSGVLFLNVGDGYYSGKGEPRNADPKSSKRRMGLRAVDARGLGLPRKCLIGIPWRVALKMTEHNWVLRSPIIWVKKANLVEPVQDRPSSGYEYIFMFARSRHYYYNAAALKDLERPDIWPIVARPRRAPGINTASFPDELARRCIDLGCPDGGVILDPFAGAGTTLRVALSLQRDAIGIDLSPQCCSYIRDMLVSLAEDHLKSERSAQLNA